MAGAKLHAVKYEDQIRRRGRRVKWQEAVTCSCINFDSGQPAYECKACDGKGYTLADPIEDVALLMSVTHNKEFEEMAGIFEIGDAIMTVGARVPSINEQTGLVDLRNPGRPNPIFHCGMYDLITLTDDEYKTSEVLVKGTPMYARPADTLLNEDVVEVLSVRKSDPFTGEVKVYEKDTDYTNEGHRIVWQGVNQPQDGEQYTVQYTHRPVFIILKQLPTPRYQDGQDLPKKVALRYRAGGFDNR
jgi:hypothetical protein